MAAEFERWSEEAYRLALEIAQAGGLTAGQLFVVGASTSEVLGSRIGTAGATDVAAALFGGLQRFRAETGIYVAYQCCEHLNRALVVEREAMYRCRRRAARWPHMRIANCRMPSWSRTSRRMRGSTSARR